MAGIKQPIQDVLTLLATMQVTNNTNQLVNLQPRIWNNQLSRERTGESYDFLKPAVFVEIINNVQYAMLGQGFQSADVGWKIHLIHEMYDAEDGTFDQDLAVFDLRDQIVALLSLYQPTACGPLVRTSEGQDYDHDNLYHYVIDFVCNFIDSKGSSWDPSAGKYVNSNPPTALQINETYADEGLPDYAGEAPENNVVAPQTPFPKYNIPQ
jgi:hypothetical protein